MKIWKKDRVILTKYDDSGWFVARAETIDPTDPEHVEEEYDSSPGREDGLCEIWRSVHNPELWFFDEGDDVHSDRFHLLPGQCPQCYDLDGLHEWMCDIGDKVITAEEFVRRQRDSISKETSI